MSASTAPQLTTDEEGNSIEVTDEMKAEAMAAAKTTADAIYAAYKAGTSLEDAAAEYESTATYASSDSFSYSSSVLGEWLYDDARQAGDSAVLEDSDSSNYYVVVFNGRSRNEYNTVNVRHILIQPEASELDSEDDEAYEDDVAAKDAEAAQKAQDILDAVEGRRRHRGHLCRAGQSVLPGSRLQHHRRPV